MISGSSNRSTGCAGRATCKGFGSFFLDSAALSASLLVFVFFADFASTTVTGSATCTGFGSFFVDSVALSTTLLFFVSFGDFTVRTVSLSGVKETSTAITLADIRKTEITAKHVFLTKKDFPFIINIYINHKNTN